MSAMMKSLGLDRLTIDERIALADELWENVEAETSPGSRLTDAQKTELDRRIAEAEGGIPWDQVKAEMLACAQQVRS